jgi:hypothetical protein
MVMISERFIGVEVNVKECFAMMRERLLTPPCGSVCLPAHLEQNIFISLAGFYIVLSLVQYNMSASRNIFSNLFSNIVRLSWVSL